MSETREELAKRLIKEVVLDAMLEATIAWIEANRGWIDCASFKHPTEGPKMKASLKRAMFP